mmetsp:Transcript_118764/g.298696  ORF Transcript_118764/g.298696 Transcript_118764/m.298696 type:complete len:466 (+) Transcript_118764:61-1458(+)
MAAFLGRLDLALVATTCVALLLHCVAGSSLRGGGAGSPGARGEQQEGQASEAPLNILFVGNSFTFGPSAFNATEQNNLPRFFKLVAESLGHKVQQQEDTIGGCSVFIHRPSINPSGLNCSYKDYADCVSSYGQDCNLKQCWAVNNTHIELSDGCSVNPGVFYGTQDAPCPQRLMKQDFGAWDVVVLQDESILPSVTGALNQMLAPSVSEYSQVLRQSGAHQKRRFGEPIVAMFMTWSYYAGGHRKCPGSDIPACFPNGTLDGFTDCETSDAWSESIATHPCQGYSLARGYAEMLEYGAKVLVPSGVAWEAARGSEPIPQQCKAAIDAEFPSPGPLANLSLPLKLEDETLAQWRGARAQELFLYHGPDYNSTFCDDGCKVDNHPSALGQYLNALVFFATLFEESPIGAAWPQGQVVDGMALPTIDGQDAATLQRLAHEVVLPHLATWWSGSTVPRRTAPPAMPMPL